MPDVGAPNGNKKVYHSAAWALVTSQSRKNKKPFLDISLDGDSILESGYGVGK